MRLRALLSLFAIAVIGALGMPIARAIDWPPVSAAPSRLLGRIEPLGLARIGQNLPHKVIYQYGLSSVLVGRTGTGSTIGYRHVLLAIAPSNLNERDERELRQVVPSLVAAQATTLREALDAQPSAGLIPPGPGTLTQRFDKTLAGAVSATDAQFIKAAQGFKNALRLRLPKFADMVMLGIGTRPCDAPSCMLGPVATDPRNRSFARYAKVHEWMKAKGMVGFNQPYVLNVAATQAGSLGTSVVGTPPYLTTHASLDVGYEWQKPLPAPELRAAFVNAAVRSRRSHDQMSYVSAELASLTLESSIHVADVFDSPFAAASRLRSDPTVVLTGISDENVRARLTECVRLRGTFEPEAAGKCAGAKLTSAELVQCMAGSHCMPTFGDEVNPAVLLVSAKTSITDLVIAGGFPRINLGPIDEVKIVAGKCAAQNRLNSAAAFCLIKSQLNKDAAAQVACIEAASRHGRLEAESCATSLLPPVTQAQLACLQDKNNKTIRMAICAGVASLPPAAQKLVICVLGPEAKKLGAADALTCVGAASGSREARCLLSNRDDWAKAAICISGATLPEPVRAGMACAGKSTDAKGFAVCMIASNGSGDAQRLAECYVEGQGHPAAVAVCLAAPSLTVDQRIALECAAETDGALPAFAACTGGRLATKELVNCRGQRFAEGNCFGENNEIRKLSKQLGIDIGPNSIVAKVADVQLQVLEFEAKPLIDMIPTATQIYNDLPSVIKPPDPTTRGGLVGGGVPGAVVDEYCKHNWCP